MFSNIIFNIYFKFNKYKILNKKIGKLNMSPGRVVSLTFIGTLLCHSKRFSKNG